MINSLFIVNPSKGGDIIVEKHWRRIVSRTLVLESFWELVCKEDSYYDVPPVLRVSSSSSSAGNSDSKSGSTSLFFVNIFLEEQGLFLVAVVTQEVSPLLVISLLRRIDIIFTEYNLTNETKIKANFAMVYQLLEEVLDNGFPFVTEPNALTSLVPKPTSVIAKVGGRLLGSKVGRENVSSTLEEGVVSNIPWRKANVHHLRNEFFVDIIETLECSFEPNGFLAHAEVVGKIECNSKLSGTPDLTLKLRDPLIFGDDLNFHPCVRIRRFNEARVFSFVPPDGQFTLATYKISMTEKNAAKFNFNLNLPVYCTPRMSFSEDGGQVHVVVGSKPTIAKPISSRKASAGINNILSGAASTSAGTLLQQAQHAMSDPNEFLFRSRRRSSQGGNRSTLIQQQNGGSNYSPNPMDYPPGHNPNIHNTGSHGGFANGAAGNAGFNAGSSAQGSTSMMGPQTTGGPRGSSAVNTLPDKWATVDAVKVTIPFPSSVSDVKRLDVDVGNVKYDSANRLATWVVGKLSQQESRELRGKISLKPGATTLLVDPAKRVNDGLFDDGDNQDVMSRSDNLKRGARRILLDESQPIVLDFVINGTTASGICVESLELVNESYNLYKGIRATLIGKQVRYDTQ
eukprot:g1375.t1